MTKYRVRLKNGRVVGPFTKTQLFEIKGLGHISGSEEVQVFPTGDWLPMSTFEFYAEIMDSNRTIIAPSQKEETFVIDLTKLRIKKDEMEMGELDLEPTPIEPQDLTETIKIGSSTASKIEEPDLPMVPVEMDWEEDKPAKPVERMDKTVINPIAQQELARFRRELKMRAEADAMKAGSVEEEDKTRISALQNAIADDVEEPEVLSPNAATQMFVFDDFKSDLMLDAEAEEKVIKKDIKRRKKEKAAEDDEDEEGEDDEKKSILGSKKNLVYALAAIIIGYVFLFPEDDKPKKPVFQHLSPQVVFPIPFDKSDKKRSELEYTQGIEFYKMATYPHLVKAGLKFKSSYENNLDNVNALNFLVRTYAEELSASKTKLVDAHTLFNIIQSKRPFLLQDPNGVIGLNLFYMAIGKSEAAVDVVAKYLKLNPKNVTQDLFAVYLQSLLRAGKIDTAKQFYQALAKAPNKNQYTLDALIDFHILNQEPEKAGEYVDQGLKAYPNLVRYYLLKSDLLIREKKFNNVNIMLKKALDRNLEYNDKNRAKYFELSGLLAAYKGKPGVATAYFMKSLKLEDSNELRMKLADLSNEGLSSAETEKLIAESKAIKLLVQAKDFYDKKNYELALSSVARASDSYPNYIPVELFLSKIQLRLGLAQQAINTLEDLVKKYPDNKDINLAVADAYIETYKFNAAKARIAIISSQKFKNSWEYASITAKLFIRMGDPLASITWLKSSINLNPLNDWDIFQLAEIFTKRANFNTARILLNKCMELDPIRPEYRIAYARLVYETQDDQAAIGYLLSLLNEFGESAQVLSEIAIFYYRAGKIKDFQDYKKKIESLPYKDKALFEFLIKAALLDERYDEIPGLVEQLLKVEPGDLNSMMTAGRVLFENGKLVDAAKWFIRIQEKMPTYPKVQYYIARIKYLSGKFDDALAEIKKDIAANGENDQSLVFMGEVLVEKGDMIEAEKLYKKAQKLNPRSYEALIGLADLSTKRNNYEQALDLYKRALKEKNDVAIVHKKIGDVYRLLGQGTLALESYKVYLEMEPEASDKKQIDSYIQLMQ